jgi:hypothetical protein
LHSVNSEELTYFAYLHSYNIAEVRFLFGNIYYEGLPKFREADFAISILVDSVNHLIYLLNWEITTIWIGNSCKYLRERSRYLWQPHQEMWNCSRNRIKIVQQQFLRTLEIDILALGLSKWNVEYCIATKDWNVRLPTKNSYEQ